MQIVIDTATLTAEDKAVLATLLLGDHTPKTEPAAKAEPAKKAAAAKKAVAPTKKVEPEPEAEEDENLLGDDEAPTKKDALAAASKLVSEGNSAAVKTALETVGVARVSQLEDAQVPEFLAALEG